MHLPVFCFSWPKSITWPLPSSKDGNKVSSEGEALELLCKPTLSTIVKVAIHAQEKKVTFPKDIQHTPKKTLKKSYNM